MARKEKQYHYVYKTTCVTTGRYYIGIHSTDNLEDGYLGSGRRLKYSINKHGKSNHKKEILEWLPDRESLRLREAELVTYVEISKELCMNIAIGGGKNANYGGYLTDEHKARIGEANSGENNGMYGRRFKMKKKHKLKIQEGLLSSKKLKESRTSKEFKDKISDATSEAIYVLDTNKNIIGEFKNMTSACEFLGCKESNIFNARRDNRMVKRKYWIIYKKDYDKK